MRGRRFKTQEDIDRYVAQGYGQGQGVDYIPWLRVQDVPSHGRSRKVNGTRVVRPYHLLSDLEYAYFVLLEFSEEVVDIREQYPLFPVSELQEIAHAKGIRYPKYAGTDLPFVMTTDFLITRRASDGTTHLAARTVKYAKDFQPSPKLERTLQKLEVEQSYWAAQGINWGIVTDEAIDPILSENLQWLRQGATVDRHLMQSAVKDRFLDAFRQLDVTERTLSENIRRAGRDMHLPYRDSQLLFKHLVWTKSITLDLRAVVLKLTAPPPFMQCANDSINHPLRAVA